MATIKELREEQARIATNARAKFDEIKDDTKEVRAKEIEAEHDVMMADFDKIGDKINRQGKMEKVERDVLEAAEREDQEKREGKRPNVPAGQAAPGEAMDYRTAFHSYIRAQGQLGDMEPEARAVLRAGEQKVEHRVQSTTTTAGGFTIPTELATFMTQSMLAWGPMYDPGITSEIVTSGGGVITMPTVDDTTTVVVKHVEGTTLTDDGGSDVTFGSKTLNAYPFNTEWLRVSKELVDDSAFAMEALLGNLLGERLGRRANLELTIGDGTGDPNGIVVASGLGVTAAATAAITFDELMDLEHSVDPAYRMGPKVRYMMNDATLKAVRKLKNGDGDYIWQRGGGGIPDQLNGHSYSINQAMPAMTSGLKAMVFGDFSKYYVRKVGAPLIGAIQDKDFWPGFGIAGYIRFDGELSDTAAVRHLILA